MNVESGTAPGAWLASLCSIVERNSEVAHEFVRPISRSCGIEVETNLARSGARWSGEYEKSCISFVQYNASLTSSSFQRSSARARVNACVHSRFGTRLPIDSARARGSVEEQ